MYAAVEHEVEVCSSRFRNAPEGPLIGNVIDVYWSVVAFSQANVV